MHTANSTGTHDDPFDLGAVLVIDTAAANAPRRCATRRRVLADLRLVLRQRFVAPCCEAGAGSTASRPPPIVR